MTGETELQGVIATWTRSGRSQLCLRLGPGGGGSAFEAHLHRVVEDLLEGEPISIEVCEDDRSGPSSPAASALRIRRNPLAETSSEAAVVVDADLLDIRDEMAELLHRAGASRERARWMAERFSPATSLADLDWTDPQLSHQEQIWRLAPIADVIDSASTGSERTLELARVLLLLDPEAIEVADEWADLASSTSGRSCTVADIARSLTHHWWMYRLTTDGNAIRASLRNPLARTLAEGLVTKSESEHFRLFEALRTRAIQSLMRQDRSDLFVARQLPRQAMASFSFSDLFQDAIAILVSDTESLVREIERRPLLALTPGPKAVLLCAHHLGGRKNAASNLELSALRIGLQRFADELHESLPDRPWRTVWNRARAVNVHRVISRQRAPIHAIRSACAPGGEAFIIAGASDGTIWKINPYGPNQELWRANEHSGEVRAVDVVASGELVLAAGITSSNCVVAVECGSGDELWVNATAHTAPLSAVAVSNHPSPMVASSGVDGRVALFQGPSGHPVHEESVIYTLLANDLPVEIRCLQFLKLDQKSASHDTLAFGAVDGSLGLIRLRDAHLVARVRASSSVLNSIVVVRVEEDVIEFACGTSAAEVIRVRLGIDPSSGWTVDEATVIARHRGSITAVRLVAASDGSAQVLASSVDGTWSMVTLDQPDSQTEPIAGHVGPIWAIEPVSSEPRLIATSGGDGSCRVWIPDAVTEEDLTLERPTRHSGPVAAIRIRPDGDDLRVWTGGVDGEVRSWSRNDPTSGRPVLSGRVPVTALEVQSSPTDESVIVYSATELGELYRIEHDHRVHNPRRSLMGIAHQGVTALHLSRRGDQSVLASGGRDGAVMTWDLDRESVLTSRSISAFGEVTAISSIESDDNGLIIIIGDQTGTITFCGFDGLNELWRQQIPSSVTAVSAIPLHTAGLIVGRSDGAISFAQDSREPLGRWTTLDGHDREISDLAALVVGGRLVVASAGMDRTLRLWDLATRQKLQEIELDGHPLSVSAASPFVAVATSAGASVFEFNQDPLYLGARWE